MRKLAAIAVMLILAGCDGEVRPPTASKVPYSVQQIDAIKALVEVDYGGRRHVFLESYTNTGVALVKLGDYPIATAKEDR